MLVHVEVHMNGSEDSQEGSQDQEVGKLGPSGHSC